MTGLNLSLFLDSKTSKAYGAVSTPKEIVDLMIKLSGIQNCHNLRILEPGCGFCDFILSIKNLYPKNHFTGVEVNPSVYSEVISKYPDFKIMNLDFLLWDTDEKFDIVIGNPPYGIIGDESHYPIYILKEKKEIYKRLYTTWYGKYNTYGAFIEKGIRLLKPNGKLIYIVPATFMILDDFKLLRKFLAASGRLQVYYLGPKVFQGKSVSTAIIIFQRGVSGLELYKLEDNIFHLSFSKDYYDGDIIRFDTAETVSFENDKSLLSNYFIFHFAARSPEIKKHPLVSNEYYDGLVPVLTGRNLHSGWIDYDSCFSGFWMPQNSASTLRDFYAIPHIVIGHTKGGRLVAALDDRCFPWREDIHLIPKGVNLNLQQITDYLNSQDIQNYVKKLYKDISPHITITQLKRLPLETPAIANNFSQIFLPI